MDFHVFFETRNWRRLPYYYGLEHSLVAAPWQRRGSGGRLRSSVLLDHWRRVPTGLVYSRWEIVLLARSNVPSPDDHRAIVPLLSLLSTPHWPPYRDAVGPLSRPDKRMAYTYHSNKLPYWANPPSVVCDSALPGSSESRPTSDILHAASSAAEPPSTFAHFQWLGPAPNTCCYDTYDTLIIAVCCVLCSTTSKLPSNRRLWICPLPGSPCCIPRYLLCHACPGM